MVVRLLTNRAYQAFTPEGNDFYYKMTLNDRKGSLSARACMCTHLFFDTH